MAKKTVVKSTPVVPTPPAPQSAKDAPPKKLSVEKRLEQLEGRVTELESDNLRLAQLCGQVWGEPLASAALEIVKKRQGKA